MKANAVVVIPYYHSDLTECEEISFQSCLSVLKNYPIVLVIPQKISRESCPTGENLSYEVVPDFWLESIESYNQMMLTKEFYIRFDKYEYMLVFQLDAFVFFDSLDWFCKLQYDYIGAPWLRGWKYLRDMDHGVWHVGNGGFSLRKISTFINILNTQQIQNTREQEDLFWASRSSEQFKVAPLEIALQFSFEQDVRQCFLQNKSRLPFGCHAWEKYDFDFWRPIFEKRGYFLSTQISEGIDKRNNYLKPRHYYLEADAMTVQSCLETLSGMKKFVIYVFGAGTDGAECIWLLRHSNLYNVGCIDSNSEMWGNNIWDVIIQKPLILKDLKNENTLVIIAVKTMRSQCEILCQLEAWGYQYGCNIFIYNNLIKEIENKFM